MCDATFVKKQIQIRVEPQDLKLWKKTAKELRLTLSEFIRMQVYRFFRKPVPDERELG